MKRRGWAHHYSAAAPVTQCTTPQAPSICGREECICLAPAAAAWHDVRCWLIWMAQASALRVQPARALQAAAMARLVQAGQPRTLAYTAAIRKDLRLLEVVDEAMLTELLQGG